LFKERIERSAPSIIERDSIDQAVETGQLVIDSLFPIGRGQRQLIIGDKKTGKTTIALDLILSQNVNQNNIFLNTKKNLFTVLVSIGQKEPDVLNTLIFFEKYNLNLACSVVLSSASSLAPLQYTAPFVGCTLGEFYRNNGLSSVAVYDDLSKHAIAYRQLALLLRRPPGREAFPSDIFYLHARLLERAGRLAKKYSGGSLTAFPVVETQAGDISAYIPTNIISITDGQLFLDQELFSKGHRPAIHTGLSVSRIGSSAQSKTMKQAVGPFKLLVAQLKQLERFESFASDLDQSIRNDILRGKVLTSLLKQIQHVVYPVFNQVLLILFSINIDLEDLDGIVAADYGSFFKDLVKFTFSESNNNLTYTTSDFSHKELVGTIDFDYYNLTALKALDSETTIQNLLVRNDINESDSDFSQFITAVLSDLSDKSFVSVSYINGFLVNLVESIANDAAYNLSDTSTNLYGVFRSYIALMGYSFNYWTAAFFLSFLCQ